ncbi:winged helix-turn-helix domain-containing protein [Thermosulfuriphilus ammonigenes]|uniref:Winged helix-turn-helix domain-containing protein n=1 Tax=Thermosulfuriphilus ammonigenes TaxID=1936021 RepID=A0A6G7PYG7_9BACT|nr:winged helix-turn-helix transcriptional regulator [Thermosulfuriphilus ammonigenes]MBA2849047.1 putative HTH transcriptional regulator [Thermosulfuriphilus ammonigenes]QIJ72734.1 winged helix-turn-helix domain-containing protein [Thermosulfuriphilus ammonigenes]
MCQRLVSTVDIRRKLSQVAPEAIVSLFEDWLEELEEAILNHIKEYPTISDEELAEQLKISKEGVTFLLDRMVKEGKIRSIP